jgi:hypothetical protein
MKTHVLTMLFIFLLIVLSGIGEAMCIYKAVKCNWDPIGKAEIVYTASALCGAGAIVGYIDVEDK